jgi:hypothetical protein
MRVKTDDPTSLADLLGFFRASGCIAYFDAKFDDIEVIAPHLFGTDEKRRLQDLLASWQLEHPKVEVEAVADVAA